MGEPLTFFGLITILINIVVLYRAFRVVVRLAHNVVEIKTWLDREMNEDSGESLKDLAVQTDERLKKVTRDVESISRRINRIEGKVDDKNGPGTTSSSSAT